VPPLTALLLLACVLLLDEQPAPAAARTMAMAAQTRRTGRIRVPSAMN